MSSVTAAVGIANPPSAVADVTEEANAAPAGTAGVGPAIICYCGRIGTPTACAACSTASRTASLVWA